MTGYRRWIAAAFAIVASMIPSPTHAQKAIKSSDLVGTWEEVSWKNLKTGAVDTVSSHSVAWVQFSKSRWMLIEMENGRKAMSGADFSRLSSEEQVKANYAKVWDDRNAQIFVARAGTYRLERNVMFSTRVMALQPDGVGMKETFTVVRHDHNSLTLRGAADSEGVVYELTLRRLD